MRHADTVNSRNMLRGRPPYWKHYVGAVGEVIFSMYSGLPVDETTIGRGDEGSDFPGGIQVKCSDTRYEPNLMVLKSLWERKPAKLYVLCWLNEPKVFILGAITSQEFLNAKETIELGHGPTYVVRHQHLLPIEQFVPRAIPLPVSEPLAQVNRATLSRDIT